jgi:1,4-dihydroxy-2-naphthoyl-CoA hydrolase
LSTGEVYGAPVAADRAVAFAVVQAANSPVDPWPSGEIIETIRRSTGYQLHELSGSRVRATISLDERHHQPFGVVDGGVYAIVVEGVASAGACVAVADRGMYAVGTSNTTDFLRPVTVADIEVVAEPIFQGRTQQLWQVLLTRIDDGKLVARGQLRLQNLPIERAPVDMRQQDT